MLDNLAQNLCSLEQACLPLSIQTKPSITIVGLGYVGAVSAGCLASFGHRILGVDLDESRCKLIASGQSPIHEAQLEDLLTTAVNGGLLETTSDLARAVRLTDVTIVSVGTPTGPDGGCDTSQIAAVAHEIGAALKEISHFHAVVLRCSVPPGTTSGVMGKIIEETSGKAVGIDFGLAFVPEFLREGVAVDDFHTPPKTVVGASDPKTENIVARIFEPVDASPVFSDIEAAEMLKYVSNVWHATKVCFANEIGRLSKSMGIDGRRVMELFCEDRKLNLSSYYLKPGFAYGGSCLPKDVRAMSRLADCNSVNVPLIDSLTPSNNAQIDAALRLIRNTGARRVTVLGLAFKPGTDDLRESPILEVMAQLALEGVKLRAHDFAVTRQTSTKQQLAYVKNGSAGLSLIARNLPRILEEDPVNAIDGAEAVIVAHGSDEYRALLKDTDLPVVDIVRLFDKETYPENCFGIGW